MSLKHTKVRHHSSNRAQRWLTMLIKTSVETTRIAAVHCLLWQLALTMVLLDAVGH